MIHLKQTRSYSVVVLSLWVVGKASFLHRHGIVNGQCYGCSESRQIQYLKDVNWISSKQRNSRQLYNIEIGIGGNQFCKYKEHGLFHQKDIEVAISIAKKSWLPHWGHGRPMLWISSSTGEYDLFLRNFFPPSITYHASHSKQDKNVDKEST